MPTYEELHQRAEALRKKSKELSAKVPGRLKKAQARLDWAKKAKDDGFHIFRGIRDKFLSLLTPRNQKTQECLKILEKVCKHLWLDISHAEPSAERIESVYSKWEGWTEKYLTKCNSDLTKLEKYLRYAEAAYQKAKNLEKAVYVEMTKYMASKQEEKDKGKESYKAWKAQFEAKIKELQGDK